MEKERRNRRLSAEYTDGLGMWRHLTGSVPNWKWVTPKNALSEA